MEKRTQSLATLGLLFITFLTAIQFIFLKNVPDSVPTFAFLCITNSIGLVIVGVTQLKKIRSINKTTIRNGFIFAIELTGCNFFVLLGSHKLEAVIISSLMSLYFIFVTPLLLLLKRRVNFFSTVASVVAGIALLLMFGADTEALFSSEAVVYLIIADLFFAAYVVSVSILGEKEDGVQLSFTQMFFSAILAVIGWFVECMISGKSMNLPINKSFWISAIFIGIAIRALYSIIQISCQKHVAPLKASLIFSSEIIITLITNPFLSRIFGIKYTPATGFQVAGCILFIIAALMIDEEFMKKFGYEDMQISGSGTKTSISKKIIVNTLSFALAIIVIQAVISMSAIHFIRIAAVDGSVELGEHAAKLSATSMLSQLEENISGQVEDKSTLAEQKLSSYADSIEYAADYAHVLISSPENFPEKPVLPPNNDNYGNWCMQRVLADESVVYNKNNREDLVYGNMETIFASIIKTNPNAATVYMGTETGLLISYDIYSSNETDGEVYYNYFDSEWYTLGKKSKHPVFTDTYLDGYGRGLTITCSAPFYDKNGKFAGCVAIDILMQDLNDSMVNDGVVIPNYAMLIDVDGTYISGYGIDSNLENTGSIFDANKDKALRDVAHVILSKKNGIVTSGTGENAKYIAFASIDSTGWILCILSPVSEVIAPAQKIQANIDSNTKNVVGSVEKGIVTVIQGLLLLSAIILLLVTFSAGRISNRISNPIIELENDVRSISGGNFDRRTSISTDDEIGSLAKSFNIMADSLQEYIENLKDITAKEQRMVGELQAATQIQTSMLPRNFDEYNVRKEFDIFAMMTPAKEVGGDFYDFFYIDDDHLALVIADVSGKGVPAALFMVIAKTLIKDQATRGVYSPSDILTKINDKLCEGNEGELFVTVWLAIIEISTGKGKAANAGHEHPALRHKDGIFELIKYRHSPAVATLEGLTFKEHDFVLLPGDTLFVYTDGVPEATNAYNVLFDNDRMLQALNSNPDASPDNLLENVKKSVDAFVGAAPQFDDLTMLGFKYFGPDELL